MSISLVMATYNGAKYLREQMDSIYNQTIVPDEIIVVDDCSTDNTLSVLSEYEVKGNLKVYVNEKNQGVSANFERAIKLAQGDYICISDQDDVWFPNKIETSLSKLKKIENGKPACVSSFCTDVDSELHVFESQRKARKDSEWEYPLYEDASQGSSLMFNKQMKDLILPLCKYFIYDHYIGVFSCFLGNRATIGSPLMYYRHHGDNVVAGKITHYHEGLSEAMALYYLLKRKERHYLLTYLRDYKMQMFEKSKRSLFDEVYSFYDVDSHFVMIKRVLRSKYFSCKVKFFFVVFVFSLIFLKNRRVVSMEKPF